MIYSGLLLNKAVSSVKGAKPLYQEVFVEVKAFDVEAAKSAIKAAAKKEETSYKNETGDIITWTFERVIDVSPVLNENFKDGVRELYSRHFRDIEAYKAFDSLA